MVVNRSCLVVKMKLLQKPGMMTLVALGISVAYIYSLYAFYMNNFSSATGHTMDFLGISNLNFNYAIRTLDRNECCRKSLEML